MTEFSKVQEIYKDNSQMLKSNEWVFVVNRVEWYTSIYLFLYIINITSHIITNYKYNFKVIIIDQ